MSVLIKGMKFPDMCGHCRFATAFDCGVDGQFIPTHDARRKDCPLIEVPEPHGRLIDADKMRESIRKQTAFLRLIGGEFAEIAETLEKGFLQEIDNAPTIIPSSEEGE